MSLKGLIANAIPDLPQLQYVIFEVVRFPLIPDPSDTTSDAKTILGPPEQDKVLLLDRMYTSITYRHASMNTNYKFFNQQYFTDKGGLMPVKINMNGTWGFGAIYRGGMKRDGFERFKEFRDELFNKYQSLDAAINADTKNKKYVYGMNFYDMIHHWWGEVDIKEFLSTSDARMHTKLQFYNISMLGLNSVISVTSKDFLVGMIKNLIEAQKVKNDFIGDINNFIDQNTFLSGVEKLSEIIDGIQNDAQLLTQTFNEMTVMDNLYNGATNPLSTLTQGILPQISLVQSLNAFANLVPIL